MLFFIEEHRNYYASHKHLNTSHVILYHAFRPWNKSKLRNLNTSHVILYQGYITEWFPSYLFKYISCYSLSLFRNPKKIDFPHLNTSHVILYPVSSAAAVAVPSFKYISCYSLSSP